MNFFKKQGLQWLEYPLFSPYKNIKHASLTRLGGDSLAPYDSLNVGELVGDSKESVSANLKKIENIFEIPPLYSVLQTHSKIVLEAQRGVIAEADSIITNQKGIPLLIKHADCQAALFFDPVNEVIAAVHAGWRGSVQNIYKETIEALKTCYHVDPKNLRVAISPSLGPKNSEFKNFEKELPPSFSLFQVKPFYFDFWAISRFQLEKEGILPGNIEIAEIDTTENTDLFFSHRVSVRQKTKTGRLASFIMLT